jgi:2C-methyl-D-erythritol 2,4-cyclodiphosphate synthase
MITYSQECVTLFDVCQHNALDYDEIMEAISDSDISFGTNYDTLISRYQLQDIVDGFLEETVDLDWGKLDDKVLISLGS